MTRINKDSIERLKKTAKERIDRLTDEEAGEVFRKYFDPKEPSPNVPQERIDKVVEIWLGKL
jgi:hypothetical protein